MGKKRFMAAALAVIMGLSFNSGVSTVYAQEESSNDAMIQPVNITEGMQQEIVDYASIKEITDLEEVNFDGEKANIRERTTAEKVSVDLTQPLAAEDNDLNNSPDYAYYMDLGDEIYDSVTEELEQRWYAFSIEQSTKVTLAMVMDDQVDFDLYLFQLNEEESTINLIGGSATTGNGEAELAMGVLDAGIYYLGVEAASGTGSFLVYSYAGINDKNEINDSTDTASSYTNNSRMTATIDSPFDEDYYKVVIGENEVLEYAFDKPAGYDYDVLVYDGSKYYTIENGTYRLSQGTYYFIVLSNDGSYSDNEYYGIKFFKHKLADDWDAIFMWYTPDKSAVFQFNADRTKFFVNGHPIDFTYSRTVKSNGNIYFNLYHKEEQNVVLFHSEALAAYGEVPFFINYQAPFSGWSSYRNALVITVFNTYWRVNSFSSDYDGLTSNVATLIIDSNTGKVVDVMTPNPLYDNGVVLHWTRVNGVQANYNYDPVD